MFRGDAKFHVLSSKVLRYPARVAGFVVSVLLERDGECAYRARALRLHECYDCRRINSAGEKCAQGDVGQHANADSIAQQRFQSRQGIVFAARKRVLHPAHCNFAQLPVRHSLGIAVRHAEADQRSRNKL